MKFRRSLLISAGLTLSVVASGCIVKVNPSSSSPAATDSNSQTQQPSMSPELAQNPLVHKSSLQYEAPHYDKVKTEHFVPAFEYGMQQHKAEVEAIANNSEAPSFENTVVALEKSGPVLSRVASVFYSLSSTVSNPEIQGIEAQMSPKLAAHSDSIYLNPKLFSRIQAVYTARNGLDAEGKRLVEKYQERFERAGAKLNDAQKQEIRKINEELSALSTQFAQNLLKASEQNAVVVSDVQELDGLSQNQIAELSVAAQAANRPGKYQINLQNTTRHPLLGKLKNRALRERLWRASAERGLAQNGPVLKRLAELRAAKAKVLGYNSWSDYVLEAQMAKTTAAAMGMLDDMAPQAMAKTDAEAKEIQAIMKAEKQKHKLEPWDWFYYGEKVRAKKYNFDGSLAKPYFEMERVRDDGLFFAMNKLFGITFKERKDLPVYHPDVRTFEVFDAQNNSIGFFYADYFARKGKRGGAWMNALVGQSKLLGRKPVVVNCLNVPKPPEGQPALLSFDQVTTMFHEMGHAVHGLFSDVNYPTLAGTAVPRDFVEFPSQFQEDWSQDPAVVANYAKHYQTGAPIPKELWDKMLASREFNKGFDSLEYIKSALLDLEWHALAAQTGGKVTGDVESFERAVFQKHKVDNTVVPPRYKSQYFSHVFAGGYSAGYYAYIWTEVLAADAFAFTSTKGGLNRQNGDKFRELILSRGNSVDPMQQYLNYRGQKPTVDALLKRRGLVK